MTPNTTGWAYLSHMDTQFRQLLLGQLLGAVPMVRCWAGNCTAEGCSGLPRGKACTCIPQSPNHGFREVVHIGLSGLLEHTDTPDNLSLPLSGHLAVAHEGC